jgi:hypothetical protein
MPETSGAARRAGTPGIVHHPIPIRVLCVSPLPAPPFGSTVHLDPRGRRHGIAETAVGQAMPQRMFARTPTGRARSRPNGRLTYRVATSSGTGARAIPGHPESETGACINGRQDATGLSPSAIGEPWRRTCSFAGRRATPPERMPEPRGGMSARPCPGSGRRDCGVTWGDSPKYHISPLIAVNSTIVETYNLSL